MDPGYWYRISGDAPDLGLAPTPVGTRYLEDWDGEAAWRLLSAPASLDPVDDAAGESRYHVNQSHTFGRFRVAHFDEFDLALLVRHVDSPVYAMRLPG